MPIEIPAKKTVEEKPSPYTVTMHKYGMCINCGCETIYYDRNLKVYYCDRCKAVWK